MSLICAFLFLSAFSIKIDGNDQRGDIKLIDSHEKIYLHIDRNAYSAGEDIWFKVYLVDANTCKPEAQSKVVYVQIIDPDNKLTATKIIKITEGCGKGDFKLPFDAVNGEYTVRAYTNFMRNFDDAWFFRKTLFISSLKAEKEEIIDSSLIKPTERKTNLPNQNMKPDLQFFPDGGYMVNDLVSRIGFKAVGVDGKGIDISGIIVDNTGAQILDFKTMKFGLGMLKFVPQKDKSYKALIAFKGESYTYDLPVSLTSGVVMEIIERKDTYTAIVRSSLVNGINDFKFVGLQRNKFLGSSKMVNNPGGAKITIPKKILEEGIVQFTLYDNKDKPLCERLIFVEKSENYPVLTISPSKHEYRNRDLVELEISSDFLKSQKTAANTSISVSDVSALSHDQYGFDIRSYLLLNSDLRGEIEQPGYYFYSDDPQRKQVLDLLMMTQGWRQFILNDSLNQSGDKQRFAVENGISIGGSVRRFHSQRKPAKAEVSLTYSNKDEMVYNQTETDYKGHFLFEDFDFMDSTSVIVQAKKVTKDSEDAMKRPNSNFYITLDSVPLPKLSNLNSASCQSDDTVKFIAPKNSLSEAEIDSIIHSQNRHIILDEVTITAKKIERMKKKRSMYFEPSNTLDFKEMRKGTAARNVLDALQGSIAGVSITDSGGVEIRGNNSLHGGGPLFLLNGIPTTEDAILSIPVDQIDFVDVLKGGKTVIFGSAGSHGVIAVYTLSASDNLGNVEKFQDKCILNFTHPGYSIARKFYEPVYPSGKSEQKKRDNRTTLYWNPELKLTGEGKTKISFYTADLPSTYKVDLEGITTEGIPLKSELFFDVK